MTPKFILWFLLLLMLSASIYFASPRMKQEHASTQKVQNDDTVVFVGTVVKREEIWDRRSNPMMGRPDWLKELIFHIEVDSLISNILVKSSKPIIAKVTKEQSLIKFQGLQEGSNGVITLVKGDSSLLLVDFKLLTMKEVKKEVPSPPIVQPKQEVKPPIKPATNDKDSLKSFERIGAKVMIDSLPLQKSALRLVARIYKMKQVEFISMTSYSGPAPPDGGYKFWGVRGTINGKWFVWQPGYNQLQEGKELDDPHKYQKCNSPNTLISTPNGPVAISELKEGDLVLSGINKKPASVLEIVKVSAPKHFVCRTEFSNGSIIEISANHPLADGRLFGALKIGDIVNGHSVLKNEIIPYVYEFTYDILPDSETGSYYVGDFEIGSTMRRELVN